MKRYLQGATMLLTLLSAVRLSAQDGEPQLEEFRQWVRPEAKLDQAFHAMYDLEFATADAALEQFVAEEPVDPLGPAHRDFAAMRFSDTGNSWARKLLAVSPQFYDAYVATGIQKYLVSLKPAPVRWMLRLGNIKGTQDEGIHELELAAAKGRYLAPFARILLAGAHLRKQEPEGALALLSGLQRQFLHNPLFAEEIAGFQQKMLGAPPQQTSALPAQSGGKGQ